MPIVQAVVTTAGMDAFADGFTGASVLAAVDSFKVGEGGYKVELSGNVPRVPDPLLTDLDILGIEYPGRYVVSTTPTFQKALSYPADFTKTYAPSGFPIVEVACLLDFGDYNNDGDGNDPEIYEIGLFAGSVMIAYGTFDVQTKNFGNQIPFVVTLNFGG
jgi:hypothetical protein